MMRFTNNIPKVIAGMERRTKAGITGDGGSHHDQGANAPVDTGRLRSPIQARATETGTEVVVGVGHEGLCGSGHGGSTATALPDASRGV
jgi:hypothetical protein